MSDFLEEVVAKTKRRLEVEKAQVSLQALMKKASEAPACKPFEKALRHPGRVMVIAELKQASPSAGVIRQEKDIEARLSAYAAGGAAALSILTEEDFFHGSPQMLEHARRVSALPLLRKDFIVDPYQIYESRILGADAILLIASLLPGSQLPDMLQLAKEAGLEALVEVHEAQDLEHALAAKATLVGLNNRDLKTLRVHPQHAVKLLMQAPKAGVTYVVESGIRTARELPALLQAGAHAVLIGETFMRAESPQILVKEFAQACQK